jgi:hypothetical protein
LVRLQANRCSRSKPSKKNKFRFNQANLVIEFYPEEKKLILLQGGGRFELSRE